MTTPFEIRTLGEVCEVNPRDANGLTPDTLVTFVPMSAVDEKTGTILKPEKRRYRVVAKGYTPFRENDVLFAKITPCMENGKCAIAKGLENGWGFGSTEFHVLRAKERIIPQWIYYYLRQEKVRKFAATNFTGTVGQQRVPKSLFDKLKIPLPPLPIQQRIAAILEKADAARDKRRQSNQLTEEFLQSAFLEMFGDPVTNPKRWEMTSIGDVADVKSGFAFKSQEYQGSGIRLVRISNFLDSSLSFNDESVWLPAEYANEYPEFLLKENDVLIAMSGATTGKIGFVTKENLPSLLNQRVGRFSIVKKEKLNAIYLFYFFLRPSVKKRILEVAGGSAQPNVSPSQLKSLGIPLPPIVEQQKFAALVEKVESLRAKQRESERELEELFQSLMQRAFRGELVSA